MTREPRFFRIRRDRQALTSQVREEVETHVAMWTEHLIARGHAPADAERLARERFGNVDAALDTLVQSAQRRERTMIRKEWLWMVARDLVFAARQARRQRAVTLVALVTFALGIGANTAIFSVVRGILLRPLPYAQPERLAAIWPATLISNDELLYFQRESQTFSSVAAFSPGWGFAMTGAGEPRQLTGAGVSTNFFSTLGVSPALGRGFRRDESDAGKWFVAIISHELWVSQFGADRSAVGKVVDFDGRPYTVVGVMPAGFEAFQSNIDAWVPLQTDPSSPVYPGRISRAFGRLAPGATLAQATSELAAFVPRLREQFQYDETYGKGQTVVDLHDSLVGNARTSLLVLIGAVALLVLIAVANVANLLVLQASGRRRELAVRRALGASRGQMMRQLLVQSLALAVAGGALGVVAGTFALRALKAILPSTLPFLSGAGIDWGVLATCTAITLAAGIAFGIWPAMTAARVDPEAALRGDRSDTGNRGATRLRQTLVVVEVGLSVVLVAGAALMTTSLWRLGRVDLGFDPHNVTSFLINPSSGQITSAAQFREYEKEMTRRIAAIPGVVSVGAAQNLPLAGLNWGASLNIEAKPLPPSAQRPMVVWRAVVGDYFRTMRIPLVRGRLFTENDTREATPVVVIGAGMARRFWPDGDPIGQRIRVGTQPLVTIVGIVGDVRSDSANGPLVDEVYRPNAQVGVRSMHFVVRTERSGTSVLPAVRAAVRSLDQVVPIAEVRSLEDIFVASTTTRRVVSQLLAGFAALGLLLGAVGIYGVIAASVGQRTRELGIRSALGAASQRITTMVILESMRVAAIGIAGGTAIAVVATRSMRSLLFGVTSSTPAIYAVVAVAIAGVAIAASYVPARRAARVDPLIALREG